MNKLNDADYQKMLAVMHDFERQYEKMLLSPFFQATLSNSTNAFSDHFIHQNNKKNDGQALQRNIVFIKNNIKLYQYKKNKHSSPKGKAVLIIYAFVNRPTILDIQQDHSFINALLKKNITVYLLDWGDPLPTDAKRRMQYYISIIHELVQLIRAENNPDVLTLLGICQGGILSLCYAALYPDSVEKLITMVTPVDFQPSVLTGLLHNIQTKKFSQVLGNIPGFLLASALQSLMPLRWLKLYLRHQLQDNKITLPFLIAMEKWIRDCPDHPSQLFHEFVYHFYQRNDLIRGQLLIANKRVDLSQIKIPILNIYSKQDHLIPVACSQVLKDMIGSLHYQEYCFSGGHIGLFVSKKSLAITPEKIKQFIAKDFST